MPIEYLYTIIIIIVIPNILQFVLTLFMFVYIYSDKLILSLIHNELSCSSTVYIGIAMVYYILALSDS